MLKPSSHPYLSGTVEVGDPAYPYGKARDEQFVGDDAATPWCQDIANDMLGFFQAITSSVSGTSPNGVVPNNAVDSVLNPQVLDALTYHLNHYKLNAVVPGRKSALGDNAADNGEGTYLGLPFPSYNTNSSWILTTSPNDGRLVMKNATVGSVFLVSLGTCFTGRILKAVSVAVRAAPGTSGASRPLVRVVSCQTDPVLGSVTSYTSGSSRLHAVTEFGRVTCSDGASLASTGANTWTVPLSAMLAGVTVNVFVASTLAMDPRNTIWLEVSCSASGGENLEILDVQAKFESLIEPTT